MAREDENEDGVEALASVLSEDALCPDIWNHNPHAQAEGSLLVGTPGVLLGVELIRFDRSGHEHYITGQQGELQVRAEDFPNYRPASASWASAQFLAEQIRAQRVLSELAQDLAVASRTRAPLRQGGALGGERRLLLLEDFDVEEGGDYWEQYWFPAHVRMLSVVAAGEVLSSSDYAVKLAVEMAVESYNFRAVEL